MTPVPHAHAAFGGGASPRRVAPPQCSSSASAILGLQAHRAPRPAFHVVMPSREAKEFAALQARFACAGFALHRVEGDDGSEELIAVRGAVTVRFLSRAEAAAWLAESEAQHG